MKRILKHFFIFILVAVAFFAIQKVVINSMTSPFWGNEEVHQKVEFLKKTDKKYDLIAIGSSLTYRHIVPSVFKEKLGLNTFNLGCASMRNPETWYVLEKLLESLPESKKPKYMLIELQDLRAIADENKHTVRMKYFLDYKRTFAGGNYFLSPKKKRNYLANFLANEFKTGILIDQFNTTLNEISIQDLERKYSQLDGFSPLGDQIDGALAKRAKELRQNPELLTIRTNSLFREYEKSRTTSSIDLKITEQMMKLCWENGIQPILVKPAKKGGLLGLFEDVEGAIKIDVANPNVYPQFYTMKNSFDVGHLKSSAAIEYSKIITDLLAPEISK